MALNIERIEKKWEPSQIVTASYAEIDLENIYDKNASIKILDGEVALPDNTSAAKPFRRLNNTSIDFFADQTGFINLLVYPGDSGIKKAWIRIEAKDFFRAVNTLRQSVVLSE